MRDTAAFYCDQKPTVRMSQSGRDRFDAALGMMTLVSAPEDRKMRACFNRINAARKAKPGDRNYVSPEEHYTEAELDTSRKRGKKLNEWRVAAAATAESELTEKMYKMGEKVRDWLQEDKVYIKDMQRNEFINEMGSACMSAIVKQQEEKKKRGADNLPTKNAFKEVAVAYCKEQGIRMADGPQKEREKERSAAEKELNTERKSFVLSQ